MSDTMNYDYPQGASPKEIWAILREVAEGQGENRLQMQEAERRLKETENLVKETTRQVQETSRQMKQTDEQFGKLNNRFGELAEHLVAPNIMEKFNALGFIFQELSSNKRISDDAGNRIAEIDILLENLDTVMVAEVKAKPHQADVEHHIKRMELLSHRYAARNDKRTLLGAVAGAIMSNTVRDYIQKKGFYAIEQSGDTVKINIPEGFKPRKW